MFDLFAFLEAQGMAANNAADVTIAIGDDYIRAARMSSPQELECAYGLPARLAEEANQLMKPMRKALRAREGAHT